MSWIEAMRRNAKKDFDGLSLPSEKDESWRYTDLKKASLEFRKSEKPLTKFTCTKGVIAIPIAKALDEMPQARELFGKLIQKKDKISAYHFSSFMDGMFIRVPAGLAASVTADLQNPSSHSIILVEKNAALDYSESLTGCGLSTDAVEIFAQDGSSINFSSFQALDGDASGFSMKHATLGRDARISWTFFSSGSRLHRLDSSTIFTGQGSSAETAAAFLSKDSQHMDITTNAHHKVQNTQNKISARGVLLGKSSAVFRGMIKIDKQAQQTNSYLSDHMLLVGSDAVANSIPGLQIEANDVKASHGSTKGQIDEDQLFYLESRGLKRSDAEKMIIQGFFAPVFERISNKKIRRRFEKEIAW